MSLATASILKDGLVATTGGTAAAFASLGSTLEKHEVFFDGTDIRTRSSASFSVKTPKIASSAPNGYTQARNTALIRVPITLANGEVVVNTLQITLATDVETSAAQKDTLISYGAQVLADTDLDSFWKSQSVE